MEDMRRHEVRELARLTARLDAAQQTFFQAEYSRHRRNPTTALLLCLLLGAFGAHYLYFGRTRAGLLRLAFCWTLVPLVMALIEAPTMEARAHRYNASLANELLLAMKGAVEAESGLLASLVEAPPTPEVAGAAQPSAIAAPPVGAEAALIAAAWAGREPESDDPTDPPLTLEELAPLAVVGSAAAAAVAAHHRDEHTPVESPTEPAGWEPLTAEPVRQAAHDVGANGSLGERSVWQPLSAAGPDAPAPPLSEDGPAYAEVAHAEVPEPTRADDAGASWATPWRDAAPGEPWFHPLTTPDLAANPPLPERIGNGAGPEDEEPFPWFLADAHPAVAEAAASAAAVWAAAPEPAAPEPAAPEPAEEPAHSVVPPSLVPVYSADDSHGVADLPAWVYGREESAPAASEAATGEREPIFMYQVAPAPRRESVRYGPPSDDLAVDTPSPSDQQQTQQQNTPGGRTATGAGAGEEIGLAALGSVLAAGLADLLKDRSARPRTVKLTTPLEDDEFAPHRLVTPPTPEPLPAVAPQSHLRDEPMADALWAPISSPAPVAEAPRAAAAPPGPFAKPFEAPESAAAPSVAPGIGGADLLPQQVPMPAPADRAVGDGNAIVPPAYASPAAQNRRRRVVQRVIVRKMAMLEGQVVAESTVERQVPVVGDDTQMAERIKAATTDAAREALGNLMKAAPEEALPAIRMQLYALDSPSFAQRSR